MRFSARKVVLIGGALFVLAVAFLVGIEGRETSAVMDAFRSQSMLAQAAWVIVVLVPIVALPYAVWLSGAVKGLKARLEGVRQRTKALAKPQADIEAAVHHLVRTDPEDAIAAAKQRFTEAERFAQTQERRTEITDLSSRVDDIRKRQQALQQRLGPVLEKRRAIEQLFAELEARQLDVERTLTELGHGDDEVALDVRLTKMMEFVARSRQRCDDIEHAAEDAAGLKVEFAELEKRIAPLAAADDGIVRRVNELGATREALAAGVDSLLHTPEGPLTQRLQQLTDDKETLDARLAQMNEQFSQLARLREDAAGLFAGFDRALDTLAIDGGASSAAARVEELTTFVKATQAQLDAIERQRANFTQLQTSLEELQARLVPLEAKEGGVVSLIGEIKVSRDRLASKIKRMDESEEGDLNERLRKLSENRRDLEDRVMTLTDQVLRLAAIRRDISTLFDKLSNVANASAS